MMNKIPQAPLVDDHELVLRSVEYELRDRLDRVTRVVIDLVVRPVVQRVGEDDELYYAQLTYLVQHNAMTHVMTDTISKPCSRAHAEQLLGTLARKRPHALFAHLNQPEYRLSDYGLHTDDIVRIIDNDGRG